MSIVGITASDKPPTTQQLFVCPSCSKSFTRKDYLYRHEKNHSEVKPFKCDQCNLSFTRSDLLTKHFRSKSHQKTRNDLNNGYKDNTNGNLVENNRDIIMPKHPPHRIEKRNFDYMVNNSSSSSIISNNLLQTSRLNQFNKEGQLKKYKKLEISSFLNRRFNDEKIPAPPPQPSIILPAISKKSVNDNSSINPSNAFMTHSLENIKDAQSNIYDNQQQQRNSNHHLNSQNASSQTPTSCTNHRNDIPGGMDAPYGTIDNNLLWLFNDTTPGDNLYWLFSDITPLENNNNGSGNKLVNSKLRSESFTTPNSNIYPNNNHVDIASIMYQNLYNESTNTNINNNKINMTEATKSRIIDIFPSVNQLTKVSLQRFEEYLDLYWFNFAQTFPIIHQATFNPNTMSIYLLISMIVIGMAHSLDKLEYETSIAINKRFRRIIYDVIEDNTELPLSLMQALILHNFSAKNFGDTHLSKIAQIDHGANIMYLKFSGFLNNLTEPVVHNPSNNASLAELTEQWQNWIDYESCKRAVFFEFICDTQHVTFSKIRSLSAFDIKFELPCSDEVWNSADPVKFFEEYQKQPKGLGVRQIIDTSGNYCYKNEESDIMNGESKKENVYCYDNANFTNTNINFENLSPFSKTEGLSAVFTISRNSTDLPNGSNTSNSQPLINMVSKWPTFLWCLKSMMTTYKANQKEYPLDCYSLFSRYIILHGLLRICWDMRGRNLLDLGFVSKRRLSEFFKKLEKAFLNWKGYFDLHVKLYEKQVESKEEMNEKGSSNNHLILSLNNYGPTNASWANISFYYTGLFCLYADIPSVTVFASEYKNFHFVTKTEYKGIKEMEYERNKLIIEQWAKSIYGELALIEACKFLRLVYQNEETINTFSHIPQTAYLAALLIWCYEIKRDPPNLEIMNEARPGVEVKHDEIKLDASKYFDLLGNINYRLSKSDAWEYFSTILDIKNNLNDEYLEAENNHEFIGGNSYEEYKERQMNTIGVVCYVLHLLRNCKWVYSIDLVQQLEHVIITYDKL
ncbi:fungal-specific transcription factor domain-containing protein [Scheffersomyces amazonensis]|uniref:fungal-specific transcription factor domain-containing protein n=1 Tax=Scheffersomyces amazonensis TaxID=1078765 RepID=UPI00315C7FB7